MDAETFKLLGALVGFVGTVIVTSFMVWREIRKVHIQINSRMDQLLEMAKKLAHLQGLKEGKDFERRQEK